MKGKGSPPPPWAWLAPGDGPLLTKIQLLVLTEIQLLAGSFQVHPFGRRLDEEVPDELAAVLAFE